MRIDEINGEQKYALTAIGGTHNIEDLKAIV